VDAAVHRLLVAHGLLFLRCSVGAVFLYFGALKLVPGHSPAEELVMKTIDALTFGLVPGGVGIRVTGGLECALGLILLSGRLTRLAVYALMIELVGILAPLVLFPGRLFSGPDRAPTLEGQYVLKDIVLVAAAMVLAATVKGGRLVRGPHTAPATAQPTRTGTFSPDAKLSIVLQSIREERDADSVAAEHGIPVADFRRWRDELLDGAVTEMTPPQDKTNG